MHTYLNHALKTKVPYTYWSAIFFPVGNILEIFLQINLYRTMLLFLTGNE